MRVDAMKTLCPQLGALIYAKAVLLINNSKAKGTELYGIFY